MAKDSLDFVSYYRIALWLTGRLDRTAVRLQKGTQEPVFCPADMQLDETSQKLLWNEFFRQDKEEVKNDAK